MLLSLLQPELLGFLQRYPGVLSLASLKNKKFTDLTKAEYDAVFEALKVDVPFTDELRNALFALLRGNNINQVADLIQSPESIGQVLAFLQGGWRSVVELRDATRASEVATLAIPVEPEYAESPEAAELFTFR